jgi:hypothetical protein
LLGALAVVGYWFSSGIILSVKVKVLGGGFSLWLGDNIAILFMVKRAHLLFLTKEDDVPLLVDIEAEEEIGLLVDPMPPPPPRRVIPGVGLGSVGNGRRKHTFPSTSSPSLSTSDGAAGEARASTPSSSRVPPTASGGKVVPFVVDYNFMRILQVILL